MSSPASALRPRDLPDPRQWDVCELLFHLEAKGWSPSVLGPRNRVPDGTPAPEAYTCGGAQR
eukprot:7424224-Alexandrium_andersonii.AAC.1